MNEVFSMNFDETISNEINFFHGEDDENKTLLLYNDTSNFGNSSDIYSDHLETQNLTTNSIIETTATTIDNISIVINNTDIETLETTIILGIKSTLLGIIILVTVIGMYSS